jgi:uncharacterized protein YndB with AHSA1/START domain
VIRTYPELYKSTGDFLIMDKTHIATATTAINAPTSKVWDALTKPDLIKQYLFGTKVTTDWHVGSPITYKGIWQGKLNRKVHSAGLLPLV